MTEKYELAYNDYKAGMKQKEIATKYDVSVNTVKGWQQRKWRVYDAQGGIVEINQKKSGNPNPLNQFTQRNDLALKHGMFSRYIPQEMVDLLGLLDSKSPADMLWDQIKLQYIAIIRSQSIMLVKDKDELIKEMKKERYGYTQSDRFDETGALETASERVLDEIEYEIQFAWERQAQFLNAQSRAIGELRTSINQFIKLADEADERSLKLEQMQLNIDKTNIEIEALKKNDGNAAPGVVFIIDNIPRTDD